MAYNDNEYGAGKGLSYDLYQEKN